MKNKLLGNIHWIFILLALSNLYTIFEENTEKIENSKMNIDSLSAQNNSVNRKLKNIKRFKKNLTQSIQRVEEVRKQIEKVQKQLPSEVNDTLIAGKINELGESLKMKDLNVAPMDEKLNGFYFTKKFSLNASATFLQALIFFENLNKSERILNIQKFEMKEKETNIRGKFKVLSFSSVIESYRYNTTYKEKSGVEEIENKYRVP